MAKKKPIPNSTEATILAMLVRGEMFGREIRDGFADRTGRAMALGSIYTTLDRMAEKGLLTYRDGESCEGRGGNRRIYYRITASGLSALNELQRWIAVAPIGASQYA